MRRTGSAPSGPTGRIYSYLLQSYRFAAKLYDKIVWWHPFMVHLALIAGGFAWGWSCGSLEGWRHGLVMGWKYGFGIFLLFFQGEGAIGFWKESLGVPVQTAVRLAIYCSSYDIFCWFVLSNKAQIGLRSAVKISLQKDDGSWLAKFFLLKRAVEDRAHAAILDVDAKISNLEKESNGSWIARLHRWSKKRRLLYFALPVFGFLTGALFFGIPFAVACGLNQLAAFVLIAFGNSLKMVAAGYAVLRIGLLGVMLSIIAITAAEEIAKFYIKKWRRYRRGVL